MQRKHLLAAASAAAMALGLATAADAAITLGYGSPVSGTDIGPASDLQGGSYLVGTESVVPVGGMQGTLAMDIAFPADELPSSGTILTITLNGATFGVAPTGANVSFPGACLTATDFHVTGGAADSTATYAISNSTHGCTGIHLEIPVNVVGPLTVGQHVDVSVSLVGTDASHTNYGAATVTNAILLNQGLTETSITELNNNHRLTYASLMDYRTFGPDRKLGDVMLTLNTHDHYDLINHEWVDGDISASSLTVTGGFASVNPQELLDTVAGENGTLGSCVVNGGQTACTSTSTHTGAWQYDFLLATQSGNPVIQPSGYSASVSANLNHSIWSATPYVVAPTVGGLNNLGQQGAIAIIPWTASPAQTALTGAGNTIRISNIGSHDSGPVMALILASTCHPATGPAPCTAADPVFGPTTTPVVLTPSIAAGTEYLVSLPSIVSAFGEFGRGDVELIVAADPRTITLKKEILYNGGISDQSLGTFADGEAGSLLVGSEEIAPATFQDSTNDGEDPGSAPGTGVNPATGIGGNALNPYSLDGLPFVSFIPDSQPNQTPPLPPPF